MNWTIDKALEFIRLYQPNVMASGWCLMLGGGVLNRGEGKDLDLIVYPKDPNPSLEGFLKLFPNGEASTVSVATIYTIQHAHGPVEFILQDHVPSSVKDLNENTTDIMTPDNTFRKPPQNVGDRYISAVVGLQGMEFTVFEVGQGKYKFLGQWSVDEQGPVEFKDLPVIFNDFPYFPEFT